MAVSTSCGGHQSLVTLDVTGDREFSNVTLRIDANTSVSKIFSRATFGPVTVFKAGMYLPSSVTGTVTLRGQVDDGRCVLGRGEIVIANVKSGESIGPVGLVIGAVAGCEPPITDGGLGSDASSGTGGASGTGGTLATGGSGGTGTGGSARGGSGGGGVTGTGGAAGRAGSGGAGTGGSAGRAGSGGSGGGAPGTGGAAGRAGTGGTGTGGAGTGGRGTGGAATGGSGTGGRGTGGAGTGGGGGATGTGPCAGLCANPVTVPVNTNSGALGTGATCHEVIGTIAGITCGNFLAPRTFSANGTSINCANGSTVPPAARNGGTCLQASAGDYPYAYFTTYQ